MAAWQMGNSKQHSDIVKRITKTLQDITEEEAQALRLKDKEPAGLHDKISRIMERGVRKMQFRRQTSHSSQPRSNPVSGAPLHGHL